MTDSKKFRKKLITKSIVHIFLVCLLLISASQNYVYAENNSVKNISVKEQVEIGLEASKFIISKYGILKDEYINNYVNEVGQKLVSKIAKKKFKYTFIVLDSDEINSFALPGGFVFITKGTLQILSNEDELAGVLLHEIAHIENDHVLKYLNEHKDN